MGVTTGFYVAAGLATSIEINGALGWMRMTEESTGNWVKDLGSILSGVGGSVGVPLLSYGLGGGNYNEIGYTWLHEIGSINNRQGLRASLMGNGFSGAQASAIVNSLINLYEKANQSAKEQTYDYFNENFDDLDEGVYVWDGEQWVKDS